MLASVLIMGLAACGQTEEEKMEETTAEKETEAAVEEETEAATEAETVDFSIALVTDTGGIDDKSFNQGTWEGVQRFAADTGANTSFAQSNSDADYIPNLSTFAEEEYDLIVAPGFLFNDSISEVAANFPEQSFLIIDSVVADRDNVVSAVFTEHEGSFLVGVAAAEATLAAGKDTVGIIVGADAEFMWKFESGFEAGVKAVSEDITLMVDYVGDFVNTGVAQSLAQKMYDGGAYVIYHAAGSAGNGMIKEAKDRRSNGEDVWAIGVDKDQYDEGIYDGTNSAILTSMLKGVDVAAYTVSEMVYNDEFPGGEVLEFSLKNGGIGIPDNNPNLSDEIVATVNEYAAKIVAGEIVVPLIPSRKQ